MVKRTLQLPVALNRLLVNIVSVSSAAPNSNSVSGSGTDELDGLISNSAKLDP